MIYCATMLASMTSGVFLMAIPFYRATFTIPADQAKILSNVAKRLGASQSVVVSVLLEKFLPQLSVGLTGDPDQLAQGRRNRGPSGDMVRELIDRALDDSSRIQHDLML